MMAKKNLWLGMLVMVLAFGMAVVGCDPDDSTDAETDPALNGTWVYEDEDGIELKFNNGNFEFSADDGTIALIAQKGTYTASGNNITLTHTHVNGIFFELDQKLYSKTELETALKAKGCTIVWEGDTLVIDHSSNEGYSGVAGFEFSATRTYSINGNKLTITMDGRSQVYTKK
jgi:hypothetical protein